VSPQSAGGYLQPQVGVTGVATGYMYPLKLVTYKSYYLPALNCSNPYPTRPTEPTNAVSKFPGKVTSDKQNDQFNYGNSDGAKPQQKIV